MKEKLFHFKCTVEPNVARLWVSQIVFTYFTAATWAKNLTGILLKEIYVVGALNIYFHLHNCYIIRTGACLRFLWHKDTCDSIATPLRTGHSSIMIVGRIPRIF